MTEDQLSNGELLLVKAILDDLNGRAVLSRNVGCFPFMADTKIMGELTLKQKARNYPGYISKEMIEKIQIALERY